MKKIYSEFLRQTKTMGIVGSVIMILLSCFVAIGTNVSEYIYYKKHEYDWSIYEFAFKDIGYLYMAVIMIFALIMTVAVLSFLNSRNSCDFYHGVPTKRGHMYISIILSIFTWITFMAFSGCALFGILCCILKYVKTDLSEIVKMFLYVLESGIFVAAVLTVSMCVSGSMASDLFAAAIIVTVPRVLLIIMIQTSTITGNSNIYIPTDGISDFIINMNVITSIIRGIYTYNSGTMQIVTACVGTLVESIIYLIIGYVAFIKRKSEKAGNASINTAVQSVLRIAIATVLCIFGNYTCMYAIKFNDESMYVFSVLLYVGAIVVYFVYELITTRNPKTVLKSVKQFPIVIGLTVILFLVAKGCNQKAENYVADPDKIESVIIMDGYDRTVSFIFDADDKSRTIYDKDIINDFANAYNNRNDVEDYVNSNYVMVKFDDGLFGHTRNLYISEEYSEKILRYIIENGGNDIRSKVCPEYNSKKNYFQMYSSLASSLTSEDMANLYGIYKSEVERNKNLSSVVVYGDRNSYLTLVIGNKDNMENVAYAPISLYTPESINYLNEISSSTGTYENLSEYLDEKEKQENAYVNMYISFKDTSGTVNTIYTDYSELDYHTGTELFDILQKYSPDGDATQENPLVLAVEMTTEYYNEYGEYWSSNTEDCFDIYNLSDEDCEKVFKILSEGYVL